MSDGARGYRSGQSEQYSFVPFAKDKAYREVNRALIRQAFVYLPSSFFQVDVATGTGLVPQEVCALCQEHAKVARIVGIDPDVFVLQSARANTPSTPHCTVEFIEGLGQDIVRLLEGRIPDEGVDYASIHDAIHEVKDEDDKASILAAMVGILKAGGVFSYNSAFTTAAMESSALEWGRLKAKAFAILGGKRDRQFEPIKIHTPEQYRQMIAESGLTIIHDVKREVKMSRSAIEAIARYPTLVEGLFGDMVGHDLISLRDKSQALLEAIANLGITEIPRIWHEIIARKGPSERLSMSS